VNEQIIGLATGFCFGFLLQKGRVLRFEKQVGAMRLTDMTIMKFMLSAIVVGMVGIHGLAAEGVISLSHKPLNVGAVVLGGALFGIGWAVMGFCPGTSVGALGEGRWHALFAIVGMIAGAALYAEAYPYLEASVMRWMDFGKISLPQALGVSPWIVIPIFAGGVVTLFWWFEKLRI
jgi:uncharacterized membrane protein YedE/YeeE